jgi:hypothetical protein
MEWKNKTSALASYARQTNDTTLLDYAVEIRNRARRRMGDILKGTESQTGAHNKKVPSGTVLGEGRISIAKKAGISDRERKTAMRLSAMPQAEFEQRAKDPSLGREPEEKLPPGSFRCPHCGGVIVR